MKMVLPSTPDAVPKAVRFAEAAALDAAFDEELVDRMMLAVGEAVANAVEHGNRRRASRDVRLAWRRIGEGGCLSVEDEGMGLSQEMLSGAALPINALETGGRGLFIIKELTDDLSLEADGRRLLLWFAPRSGKEA